MRSVFAPGRVNLMGDHTDYTGGFVLPMAVQYGTTVTFDPGGERVQLESDTEREPADLPLKIDTPSTVVPSWARLVAGVIAEIKPTAGGVGSITTTLPIGEGLSSSAALEVGVAMALGFSGPAGELAAACQRAEQRALGVPCGIMDQLASVCGQEGHGLLIDCTINSVKPVQIPSGCDVVAVSSGEPRALSATRYAERRFECEQAAAIVGPLRSADPGSVASIPDPVLLRRARHVVTENRRVTEFAQCLADGDLVTAGRLMIESHLSLRDDFEVSTPALDGLVETLRGRPGVFGARLTGAGFGGSVVALTTPGAVGEGRLLKPSPGATLL